MYVCPTPCLHEKDNEEAYLFLLSTKAGRSVIRVCVWEREREREKEEEEREECYGMLFYLFDKRKGLQALRKHKQFFS